MEPMEHDISNRTIIPVITGVKPPGSHLKFNNQGNFSNNHMDSDSGKSAAQVSVLIPTYNESMNIINLLKSIADHLPKNIPSEAIVIDDNSPDGTGKIVDDYISNLQKLTNHTVDVIHRKAKQGLSSAIMNGIEHACGDIIVVMDGDLSHPPSVLPKMLESLRQKHCDIAVASRYVRGGTIRGWSVKRRLVSETATKIAQKGLGIKQRDPMSGFFAFKKSLIQGIKFDALGYKMLLELLVKTRGAKVQEIPYTFTNRQQGVSKMTMGTAIDYCRSIWHLYRYGSASGDGRPSVRFLSKAARFYTVGATGLAVNYLLSLLFVTNFGGFWYLHANLIGVIASMSTNFIFNKYWTFEDRDFGPRRTILQYGKFVAFSSFGAAIQLGLVYLLVEIYHIAYPVSLVLAVLVAASSNFVLNKKWTFGEKLWP